MVLGPPRSLGPVLLETLLETPTYSDSFLSTVCVKDDNDDTAIDDTNMDGDFDGGIDGDFDGNGL